MKNLTVIILLLCTVALSGFAANPDDGDNIYVFTKQSDTPIVYSLDNLDKITFSATGIKFWNNPWSSTEYDYSYFRLITFQEPILPSGVDNISHEDGNVVIVYDPIQNAVCIKSVEPITNVVIFDMLGRSIAYAYNNVGDSFVSLRSVPRGIYVVKVKTANGTVIKKIIKK